MNILHLEQFYEVAKLGNVSAGARKLRISQPAVSKSIRLLEEELGVVLFERTKKGVLLTEAGKIAFDHAGKIFAEARSIRDRIEREKSSLSGEWCLGASDTLAIHVLPKLLIGMKKRHPKLRIQIFSAPSSSIKEEMLQDRCDSGVFFTPLVASEPFHSEPIAMTEFWIVMGKRSEWARKKKIWTLEDLRSGEVPRIESRHKDYSGGFPAHFHSNKLNLRESPFLEVNLHAIKKELVLEGAGYAFLVKQTVEREVNSGEMIRIKTPKPLFAPIYWVSRKGRPMGRASQEFREELIRFFGE